MNFSAFERAQVAMFSYREARHTGNIDCIRAVALVLRNRRANGWGDGSWLSLIAAAHLTAANCGSDLDLANLKTDDRLLQLIVSGIDDIYLAQDRFDDAVSRIVCQDDPKKGALYYSFVDRKPRPWFTENIVKQPKDHAHIGNIGAMMFYR